SGYPEPTGFHLSRRFDNLTATATIRLADGDYFMFLDVPGYGNYMPDESDRHVTKNDIAVNSTTTVHFTMPDMSSGMVTISGTIYFGSEAGGNELADAWVWVGNPANGYHNGTQSQAGGTYSLAIPTGSGYKLGADKPGYMSREPASLNASASSTGNNIVLTQYGLSISGHIYSDANSNSAYNTGEGVPNGFVRAETTQCGDSDTANDVNCVRSHSPVDGTGAYELGVVAGTWKVYGMADGYSETEFGTNITITTGSVSDKNIKLTANAGWTTKSKKKSITPASGGLLDDTDPDGTGIKLTIPPNALGSSNSSGDVNAQKTSSITQTNSSDPVGGEGVTVTATDNSGQAITNLDDYIDVEMVLYKVEIDAAIVAEELSYTKLKNTKNGFWDSTTNDWVNLTTTRKAYYKENSNDTEWILYASSTSEVSAFENFINQVASSSITVYDYKLVYTSKTNHLTVFAVIMPFIATPAEAAPDDPEDPIIPPSGGGGSFIIFCASVEYGEWGECTSNIQVREVISRTPADCRLTTQQQIDQQRECVIGEEKTTEVVETDQVALVVEIDRLYLEQGEFIARADVDEILPALGNVERNHDGEQLSRGTLINRLGIKLEDFAPRAQYALTNFITYGSPDTYRLGWGERAGVLNSFMAAFGKVAQTADDWSDVIKIANGRWPTQRSETAENQAAEHFRKIYLRDPNRNNPHDDAAVTVIAYGLRPANRNMDSEAAAVRIFKAIYGYAPTSATNWDIVRAIAYSGAIR
ncbi:MAG: carboxypeptidase-like regulatory domain-containing protein, partial [Patescibacteria group bacterium]|nr:carboxypeptidase-like regulatory domain-containing protein [Patescibacteria group bacterium]